MDYPSLRFHPALQYRDENRRVLGYFLALLALLALLENNEGPVTIHRTYLTGDGFKANVEFPKKMMTAPSDGANKQKALKFHRILANLLSIKDYRRFFGPQILAAFRGCFLRAYNPMESTIFSSEKSYSPCKTPGRWL